MDGLVTDADRAVIARRAEQATVLASLRHLATYPFVAEGVTAGRLALHGWYFHFGWGLLQAAETPDGPFRQVDGGTPPAPALGQAETAPALPRIRPARPVRSCDDAGTTPRPAARTRS